MQVEALANLKAEVLVGLVQPEGWVFFQGRPVGIESFDVAAGCSKGLGSSGESPREAYGSAEGFGRSLGSTESQERLTAENVQDRFDLTLFTGDRFVE